MIICVVPVLLLIVVLSRCSNFSFERKLNVQMNQVHAMMATMDIFLFVAQHVAQCGDNSRRTVKLETRHLYTAVGLSALTRNTWFRSSHSSPNVLCGQARVNESY